MVRSQPLPMFLKNVRTVFAIVLVIHTVLLREKGEAEVIGRARLVPGDEINKTISYSLFGFDARYVDGSIQNAKLIKLVYPGWKMRVYHDETVPESALVVLGKLGVELIDMSRSSLNKMTWRFLVASDKNIQVWCSRDIDSRLSFRERKCVDLWQSTQKRVHIIRDHPSHTQVIPGGTWCGTHEAVPEMEKLLIKTSINDEYGADQTFLKHVIWPRVRKRALQHVSFGCHRFKGSTPIPVKRIGLDHVGSVFIGGKIRESDEILLHAAIQKGEECIPLSWDDE